VAVNEAEEGEKVFCAEELDGQRHHRIGTVSYGLKMSRVR
jgi:hypothetical protein